MYFIYCQADGTKKFPTEWSQAFPEYNQLLLSSCFKFSFVNVFPQYIKFTAFLMDSLVVGIVVL
jgi:hypothetical protein